MKSIVRFAVGCGLAALALTCIPSVKAGAKSEEKKHPGLEFFEGKIASMNPATQTIVVEKKPGSMTFQIAADCHFYVKGKKSGATFDDFKVGKAVTVLYNDVGGVFTAHRLAELGSDPDSKEKHGL